MKRSKARIAIVALGAALVWALTLTAAHASVHTTSRSISSADVTITVTSTGDSAYSFNAWSGYSPVLPSPPETFYWFNQDVAVSNMEVEGSVPSVEATHGSYAYSTDGIAYTTVDFDGNPTVTREGVYNFTVEGWDFSAFPPDWADGSITSAFGIDKTKPTASSNVAAAYTGSGAVTISAHDHLAGMHSIRYSADGAPDVALQPDDTGVLSSPALGFGVGVHTLGWHAIDNAGNIFSKMDTVLVNPTAVVVATLGGDRHHKVFTGSSTAFAASTAVDVVVQRRVNHHWRYSTTLHTSLAPGATQYSVTRLFKRSGTFRVRPKISGAYGAWVKFHI